MGEPPRGNCNCIYTLCICIPLSEYKYSRRIDISYSKKTVFMKFLKLYSKLRNIHSPISRFVMLI